MKPVSLNGLGQLLVWGSFLNPLLVGLCFFPEYLPSSGLRFSTVQRPPAGTAEAGEHGERKVIFEDRDWRGEKAVGSFQGVERSLTAEVLLQTAESPPVFLFDPTEDETVTCLAEFKGKLYVGSCTRPSATDTGSIFVYDPETDKSEKVYQVHEQGLIRLEVYGDTLYVVGYDANDGGWDLGNIYLHDGKEWVERRTVPRDVHGYGLAVKDGKIYVTADIFDEGLVGNNEQSKVPIYGRVMSSADAGLTWREEYRAPYARQNIGLLTVFKDKLVLNANGELIIGENGTWRALNPNNASYVYVVEFAQDKDRLLLGTPFGLCYFDGERSWRSPTFSEIGIMRGISRYGDYWGFTTSFRGVYGHGPGGTHNYPSYQAAPANSPRGNLYIVRANDLERDARGELLDWGTYQQIPLNENPSCCLTHRGRFYIGTHTEGRVLVMPVTSEGFLESAPHPIPQGANYQFEWDAATPAGTKIKFQYRTAPTREELTQASYLGPDGTSDSYCEQPGQRLKLPQQGFFQYRAVLSTEDPARTPYLKRVALSTDR